MRRYIARVKGMLRVVKLQAPVSMEALELWAKDDLLALLTLRLVVVDFHEATATEDNDLGTVYKDKVVNADYVVDLASTAVAVLTTVKGTVGADDLRHLFLYQTQKLSGII